MNERDWKEKGNEIFVRDSDLALRVREKTKGGRRSVERGLMQLCSGPS